MHKSLDKVWPRLLAMVLIGTTVLMLSPLVMIGNFEQNFTPASGGAVGVITVLESVDFISGLVSRVSHEEFASYLHNVATHLSGFSVFFVLAYEVKIFTKGQHYVLANDLHYNIPIPIYRQPSSNHFSEG